jgi:small conductance mechanosensitive channel
MSKTGSETVSEIVPITEVLSNTVDSVNVKVDLVEQMSEYAFIMSDSFYLFAIGMVCVFMIHWLVSKLLYPKINDKRFIKVVMGTLYVFILAISLLLTLRTLGFDVKIFAKITLMGIFIGAILVFFLIPLLPRLPFKLGNMVEINGVIGTVDSISSYHTTIKEFNGNMVFIPNASIISGKIINYHDTYSRRITFSIQIQHESNIRKMKQLFVDTMKSDSRVLQLPSEPMVFIVNANVNGIAMEGYCWVNNADFLVVRSDLWLIITETLIRDKHISLSIPKQEIILRNLLSDL